MMRKMFVTGLALMTTISVNSITIDEWCPPVAETEPQECVYQSTAWSCHIAQTQDWCCVTKDMTYLCDGTPFNRKFQWNKDNSTSCLVFTNPTSLGCRDY